MNAGFSDNDFVNSLQPVAQHTSIVDVRYRGVPRLIACAVVETDKGLLLVDPGPSVSLDSLERALQAEGVGMGDVYGILLTHIHLDHAGATGTILKDNPDIQVFVHERGGHHLFSPQRLLSSARRIYGDKMDTLWGEFVAVPKENLRILAGGETLDFGNHAFRVEYAPGHASHHVCYLDESTGTAFVGDVAGMSVMNTDYLVSVAPPPDIDVEAWLSSIELVRKWGAERLFLTHFGPSLPNLLDTAEGRLKEWASAVKASLHSGENDKALAARFHRQEMQKTNSILGKENRIPYQYMGQPKESWYGLARYWRKRL